MKSKSNQTIAYDFKTRDIKVLKKLLPYLIKMRARVIWAVSFLMLAKLANVAVPLALKEIVDSLDQAKEWTKHYMLHMAMPCLLLDLVFKKLGVK